ncbi:solute carrier family 26 member 6-like, partial [Latimeria chalumnae]|uniref:solute carrier family 26 member 6-like n=1 Tax=Latimeria chalumnae TaxID=7897 RepID=UPI00313E668E
MEADSQTRVQVWQPEYCVEREVFDEEKLETVARRLPTPDLSVGDRVRKMCRCSREKAKSILFKFVPVLYWLPRYPVRDWALGDLFSGISVAIVQLPQSLAYALLAALPPVYGLYTAFFPVLIYFIFGTSRHISVGAFAVVSVMIGTITETMIPDEDFTTFLNETNQTEIDTVARDQLRVQVASAVTILAGLFQILLGLVQFGFVVTYLSDPLVRSYTTAASIHVLISQLKYVFGVTTSRYSGPLSSIYTLIDICAHLPETNIGALVVSIICIVALLIVKEVNAAFRLKLPMPIPMELITVIISTVVCATANLDAKYGIAVVGEIPSGLKAPAVPDVAFFAQLVGNAFAIAVVGYGIAISMGKIFALKHGYQVDSNQELIAMGLSNLTGGFFQCFFVSCSMSRSLVQESTGGNTQVASLISSIIILAIILKIGELFQQLSKATLAAIVITNLKTMFKQFTDIATLWRTNRIDLLVWIVTFVATLLLNLDIGLAVSVGFALLTVIFRTQMSTYAILGQVLETDIYRDMTQHKEAKEIPGIKIFHSSMTVYFANAELYYEALQKKSGVDIAVLLAAKKKAIAKQKRHQKKEEKQAKKEAKKKKKEEARSEGKEKIDPGFVGEELNPTVETGRKVRGTELGMRETAEKELQGLKGVETDLPAETTAKGISVEPSPVDSNSTVMVPEPNHNDPAASDSTTLESLGIPNPKIHSIILDFSSASFVDTVALKVLKNIFRDYREIEINVYLACCQTSVLEQMERGGFFGKDISKSALFASVHDALRHCLRKTYQNSNEEPTDPCRPGWRLNINISATPQPCVRRSVKYDALIREENSETQTQGVIQERTILENVLARHGSPLDPALLGRSGPTDLDVAMFHRDAGGGQDSDSDSDLSLDEERSLSIPSSESEENVHLRGRFQRRFKRAAHSERLLTDPMHTTPK